MKKILFLLAIFSASFLMLNAQNTHHMWSVGVTGGTNQYRGDIGSDLFKLPFYLYGGLTGGMYISPTFDLHADFSYGAYGHWNNNGTSFLTDKIDGSVLLRYKLNDGHVLPEGIVSPYLTAGLGLAMYLDGRNFEPDKNDCLLPMGFGFKFDITEWMALQYQFLYVFTNHDYREAAWSDRNQNDRFFQQSVSVVFAFGKSQFIDTDGDGVADELDKCPGTPGGVKVDENGCPVDKDGDGIADYLDKCPDDFGLAAFEGCPDADGDGIIDSEDDCPKDKGLAEFNGCPDTDGDGIMDKEDDCPKDKGLAEFNGCPDTDGDGIIDSKDDCPKVKGLAEFNGCPDTDGDKIPDKDDKCPTVAGIAANKGCPEVKEETKKIFEQALTGIQFETGSDVIKPTSFGILDQVVKVMIENPEYFLQINGHTDNVGDPDKNMDLSDRRAASVMKYLTDKGVDAKRMESKGYGDTMPIEDNNTVNGRAKNRRVEFKVIFEM